MKRTAILVWLILSLSLLIHGQASNNVSVRIDPDDWNQFTYTRRVDENDLILFHYWVRRNNDQFARISWQRSAKLNKHLRVIYGGGGQVLKNQAGVDPQGYAVVGPSMTSSKLSTSSIFNFNISFQRPLLVKNITTTQTKLGKKLMLGYRHEIAKNSRGLWPEVRIGGTADYPWNNKLSLGIWLYRNFKTDRIGSTYVVTYKF
jgi:hypothetical protein